LNKSDEFDIYLSEYMTFFLVYSVNSLQSENPDYWMIIDASIGNEL